MMYISIHGACIYDMMGQGQGCPRSYDKTTKDVFTHVTWGALEEIAI